MNNLFLFQQKKVPTSRCYGWSYYRLTGNNILNEYLILLGYLWILFWKKITKKCLKLESVVSVLIVVHLVVSRQLVEVLRVLEGRVQREQDVQRLDPRFVNGNVKLKTYFFYFVLWLLNWDFFWLLAGMNI